MRNRAQYIFVALTALTFITIALSVVLFFLLIPKGLTETSGDGTVSVVPRWVAVLPLFLVEAIVEGILCFNAPISSGWMRASDTWVNFFGRKAFAVGSHSKSGPSSAYRALRVVDGQLRIVTETPLPDPCQRRLGAFGNAMFFMALAVLFNIIEGHNDTCFQIIYTFFILFFIEGVIVSVLTERRIRRDNR